MAEAEVKDKGEPLAEVVKPEQKECPVPFEGPPEAPTAPKSEISGGSGGEEEITDKDPESHEKGLKTEAGDPDGKSQPGGKVSSGKTGSVTGPADQKKETEPPDSGPTDAVPSQDKESPNQDTIRDEKQQVEATKEPNSELSAPATPPATSSDIGPISPKAVEVGQDPKPNQSVQEEKDLKNTPVGSPQAVTEQDSNVEDRSMDLSQCNVGAEKSSAEQPQHVKKNDPESKDDPSVKPQEDPIPEDMKAQVLPIVESTESQPGISGKKALNAPTEGIPRVEELKATEVSEVEKNSLNEDIPGVNDSGLGEESLAVDAGDLRTDHTTPELDSMEAPETVTNVEAVKNDVAPPKADDAKAAKPAKPAAAAAAPASKPDPKTKPAAKPADSTEEAEECVAEEDSEPSHLVEGLMTAVRKTFGGLLYMCRWLCSKVCQSIKALGGAIPLTFNFAIFSLLAWVLAEYAINPVQGSSLDFISRIRYVLRAQAWPAMLPVLASVVSRWKKTEVHQRVADESFRHMALQSINLVILATHLQTEWFHYIWVLCFLTAIYGLLYWFTLVYGKGVCRAALSQPLMVVTCGLSVYNLYKICMQDLGYSDVDIWMTTPQPELSGGYWKYATMCHMVERVFCSVDGQSHYAW